MKNRVWINSGDIVLIGLRDFGDDKADVIMKYYDEEAKELKELGELPEHVKINEGDYDYEYPLYTWLPTKEKAMAEANRLAQSWQGAPWLYSDISPQTEQVALKEASRYGLPF
jgi:hypothetical protein